MTIGIGITLEAYRMALFLTLSCQCPVTEETERGLFQYYFRCQALNRELLDFDPVMQVAMENPERTPVHNLLEFCTFSREDPFHFTITTDDVLRCFASSWHFKLAAADIDPLEVTHVPSFLLTHLLLPVTLEGEDDEVNGLFGYEGRTIRLARLYLPPVIPVGAGQVYAAHQGAVVGVLTSAQEVMVRKHLARIPEFACLLPHVKEVDFTSFQHYGNYREQLAARFARHFPPGGQAA